MSDAQLRPAVNRRAVVQGAAWSAPTVVIGAYAPALAASQPLGLNGWVTFEREPTEGQCEDYLLLTGDGAYPDRGLWISGTTAGSVIGTTYIDYYFPTYLGQQTWQVDTPSCWSVPRLVRIETIQGVESYVYRTSYSLGCGTQYIGNGITLLDNTGMSFWTELYSCDDVYIWAKRHTVVDGRVLEFTRGPILLQYDAGGGFTAYSRSRSATPGSTASPSATSTPSAPPSSPTSTPSRASSSPTRSASSGSSAPARTTDRPKRGRRVPGRSKRPSVKKNV